MSSFIYTGFVFILFLLIPDGAYAWGPGTHLEIALAVLGNSLWCAPFIRGLIESHPAEFIYGHVSPDIIVGKKYAGAIHHCHNWSIGKLILEEAKNDWDRAAAWGYLTHLAADCVAHNYFVPYKMIQSFPNRSMGHAYWEMRFDLFVPDHCWKEIDKVIHRNYTSFDHLLERVLKKTIFSYRTNKKIFNSIMILHRMRQFRFGLKTYARASRWALDEGRVRHYKDLIFKSVREFLEQPEEAQCLKADPAGLRKLRYAQELRNHLRRITYAETRPRKDFERFVENAKTALHVNLYNGDTSLPRF